MKHSIVIFIFIIAEVAIAKVGKKINSKNKTTPVQEISIKEQAQQEIHSLPIEKNKTNSTPSVDSMLSFRDPKKEVITRTWKYYLAAGLQNFQPSGVVTTESGMTYKLNNYDQIQLPQVSLGMNGQIAENLSYDFAGQFSFYSHAQPVRLNSGYAIEDSRLNTVMTSLKFGLGTTVSNDIGISAGLLTGVFNLTQTSQNSFARFSKSNQYNGFYTQVAYQMNQNWFAGLELNQLTAQNKNDIKPQNQNLQFNAKVIW